MEKEIIEHAINGLENMEPAQTHAEDLHNRLFNEDYFIIGYYNAGKFLEKVGTFEAIRLIKKYEIETFGESYTDLTCSEKVANMYAYIKGEELLYNETSINQMNGLLTQEEINVIINELEML